ncbi:MAG: AraC family transcriptional regulator [Ruminococcaceae bacterium]|nr:AraC family transcriptional regulator [Oscillospiraceae bacterium]
MGGRVMISDIKKQENGIRFDDPDFRLIVKPDCVSNIDAPDRISKAFHKEIEIKYFYEGNATLLVGSKIVQATAGDLVVMNPYEFHSTIQFGEHKGKYHLIMVDPDSFFAKETGGTSLKQMTAWSDFEFDTHIKNDGRIPELMLRIAEEQKRKAPYYRLILKGLMMELFALLLRDYAKTEETCSAEENIRYFETVEPAIQRIRDKYFEKITAEDLSSLCNVSKCHFCRIFKKATGKTAMQYLTDYRLQIADVLLSDPSHTISMIAEKCGFEDESYFCRCYKRKFGSSPGQKRSKRIKQK